MCLTDGWRTGRVVLIVPLPLGNYGGGRGDRGGKRQVWFPIFLELKGQEERTMCAQVLKVRNCVGFTKKKFQILTVPLICLSWDFSFPSIFIPVQVLSDTYLAISGRLSLFVPFFEKQEVISRAANSVVVGQPAGQKTSPDPTDRSNSPPPAKSRFSASSISTIFGDFCVRFLLGNFFRSFFDTRVRNVISFVARAFFIALFYFISKLRVLKNVPLKIVWPRFPTHPFTIIRILLQLLKKLLETVCCWQVNQRGWLLVRGGK